MLLPFIIFAMSIKKPLILRAMKKMIAATILLLSCPLLQAQHRPQHIDPDRAAIEEVILEAYINGIYNRADVRSVNLGFSDDFKAIIFEGNDQTRVETIQDWIQMAKKNASEGKLPEDEKTGAAMRIIKIEVSNVVANAQIQFLMNGKVQHTDFIGLFKFSGGWKLVNMMYEETQN